MIKWSYLDLFGCKVVPAGSWVEDSVTDAMLQGRTVQPEDLGGSHKSIETARLVSTCSPSSARTVQPQTNDIDLKTDVSLTNYHLLSRPVAKEVEAREAAFHVRKPYFCKSNSDAPGGLRTARPLTPQTASKWVVGHLAPWYISRI